MYWHVIITINHIDLIDCLQENESNIKYGKCDNKCFNYPQFCKMFFFLKFPTLHYDYIWNNYWLVRCLMGFCGRLVNLAVILPLLSISSVYLKEQTNTQRSLIYGFLAFHSYCKCIVASVPLWLFKEFCVVICASILNLCQGLSCLGVLSSLRSVTSALALWNCYCAIQDTQMGHHDKDILTISRQAVILNIGDSHVVKARCWGTLWMLSWPVWRTAVRASR